MPVVDVQKLLWNQQSGSLETVVSRLRVMGIQSRPYAMPTEQDLRVARKSFSALIAGDLVLAATFLQILKLELFELHDNGAVYYVVREPPDKPLRGWGFFAVRPESARPWLLEAPHPSNDRYTDIQAASLMRTLSARALLISTAFRCADAESSPCSGKTQACGLKRRWQKFRVSDMAHTTTSIFQVVHEVFLDRVENSIAVQLHGFDRRPGRRFHYVISDGTPYPSAPDSPSNRLVSLLRERVPGRGAVVGCNGPRRRYVLCGTTNVQGRYANGSKDPCRRRARRSAHRFVHVEQSLDARTTEGQIEPEVLEQVLVQLAEEMS